jgi:putative FmdB family regulatory protein
MPIYEYRCSNGHRFEVFQSMSEDPVTECEECGAPVERVFHPVAVHFKGSGFYTTDYARKGAKGGTGEGSSSKSSSDSGSSEKKSDSGSGSSSTSDSSSKAGDKSKSSSGSND